MNEPSLWSFVAGADWVVKFVMLLLFAASIACWTIIFQRSQRFKAASAAVNRFQKRFWSGGQLEQLASEIHVNTPGLAQVFHAGLLEFNRLRENPRQTTDDILHGAERGMRVAKAREIRRLEKHLNFLATVGSTSPYVGLLGTVWGIMSSFRALGSVQQASIAMVAPGIAEALIATAVGLFAAIPAVIAYNRFSHRLNQLESEYDAFQEEMLNVLQRQI